ncbi:MAG: DUF4190 domain-containing protein, partial [Deltaproteobacteria bacterium]|nr:DUF4190 domain-containing protein [Deltaproteobacteria bacterium]
MSQYPSTPGSQPTPGPQATPGSQPGMGGVSPYPGSRPPQPQRMSGLAITAFVLSLIFVIPFLPLIGAVMGIFATISLGKKPWLGGRGLAIAAIPVGFSVFFLLQAGMMAAIAIPAFVKYARKSKTVEATEALDKIRAGAKAWAQAEHYDQGGGLLPKGFFVGDSGWAPKEALCSGGQAKYLGQSAVWSQKVWRALQFQLSDPHYYQYRYRGTR